MIAEALDALRNGDFERFDELADPNIRLDLSRRVLNPDVYEGYEGLVRFRAEVAEIWEEMTLEPLELVENGERTLVRLNVGLKGRHGGIPMEGEIFQVWTIRDGRVAEIVVVPERGEAERLAGLA